MKARALLLSALLLALLAGLWLDARRRDPAQALPAGPAATSSTGVSPGVVRRAVADAAPAAGPPAGERSTAIPTSVGAPPASAPFAREGLPEHLQLANARLEQLRRCRAVVRLRSDAERWSEWAKSLPDAALAAADRDYEDALAWAGTDCRSLLANVPGDPATDNDLALLLAAGFRMDDPLVRLQRARALPRGQRVDANAVRAALHAALADAVAAPDVAQFWSIASAGINLLANRELGPYFSTGSNQATVSVWALAACDLGADCGPRSAALRMICLAELLCGYPSVEAALIDAYWPQGSLAALSAMRRNLVAHLRAGAGAGIFAPVAPGGG